ncbi:MAG: hypothetical protein MJ227_04035 [Bacilli bacterium]|nr:hypothetical protein [Bacilli bacterium]
MKRALFTLLLVPLFLVGCGQNPTPAPEKTTFTIVWKNYDGATIETKYVEEGVTPICSTTPVRAEDEQFTYTFKGWDPTVTPATKDMTYVATYESIPKTKTFTIRWLNYDNSVLATSVVEENNLPVYPSPIDPTRPSDDKFIYTFIGWSPEIYNANKNQDYVATYKAEAIVPSSDVLTAITCNVTDGHDYKDVNYTGDSGAKYTIRAIKAENNELQLNYKNTTMPGIIINSDKDIKKIEVDWGYQSEPTPYYVPNYIMDIYGSNTMYTSVEDLYGSGKGTLLGSIIRNDDQTEYTLSGSFKYVGLLSREGKLLLKSITVYF